MKKRCELCSQRALIYCDSDKATLCVDCDLKVHSANFLVAKHSRNLLCHRCQSPTPWNASGLNLGRAVSACVYCVDESSSQPQLLGDEVSQRRNDEAEDNCVIYDGRDSDEADGETDEDDGEHSDSDNEEEDDEEDADADNQVVPWSSVPSPPAIASTSTTDEEFSSNRSSSECLNFTMKRKRQDASLDSEDDDTRYSSEKFLTV